MTALMQLDVPALYAALDRARQQHGLSWRQLAAKLGIQPSTFSRMSAGAAPEAHGLVTMVTWLRMPIDVFTDGDLFEVDQVAALRERVTQLEQDFAREREARLYAQRQMVAAQKNSRSTKEQMGGWERVAHEYARQLNIARQQLVANDIEPDRRIM